MPNHLTPFSRRRLLAGTVAAAAPGVTKHSKAVPLPHVVIAPTWDLRLTIAAISTGLAHLAILAGMVGDQLVGLHKLAEL